MEHITCIQMHRHCVCCLKTHIFSKIIQLVVQGLSLCRGDGLRCDGWLSTSVVNLHISSIISHT